MVTQTPASVGQLRKCADDFDAHADLKGVEEI